MVALSRVSLSLLILILAIHDAGAEVRVQRRPKKLFVFGDSYSDTGNLEQGEASWLEPNGITFPGHPGGRFSDGHVFADFVASFLNLKTPVAYEQRNIGEKQFHDGMNFAAGGAGVSNTYFNDEQNLTVQINQLQEQITKGVFSKADLRSSVATVIISINDYITYRYEHGASLPGIENYVRKLIEKLKVDLKRIHDLGVAKVAVGNLYPIGCLPTVTYPMWYEHCDAFVNDALVSFHNKLFMEAIRDLNKKAGAGRWSPSPFSVIDLHRAFTDVLTKETERFPNILKPCCVAIENYFCGAVDKNGTKLYTVCSSKDSHFYWDDVHLTQAGWSAIFSALNGSLRQLFIH